MPASQHSYATTQSQPTAPSVPSLDFAPPPLPLSPKPVPIGTTSLPTSNGKPNPADNQNIQARHLLCRLFRYLFVFLLFTSIFYYFFQEAAKLQASPEGGPGTLTEPLPLASLSPQELSLELARRRLAIKEMARSAWAEYLKYAWGQDALEPVTRTAYTGWLGPNGGFTLLQSLSTLWVMDFPEEFARGRAWIAENFHFESVDVDVNVFLVVTEILGSLLSCYALSGDQMFLEKAKEVGGRLEAAYKTNTGLPFKKLNPHTQIAYGSEVFLGELGGTHLEYRYLYALTQNAQFLARSTASRHTLATISKPKNGLYMSQLDITTGQWSSDISTLFSPGSTFYTTLVKSYVQSGGRDGQALELYQQAIQAANRNFLFNTSIASLQYARDFYYLPAAGTERQLGVTREPPGYSSFGDYMLHDGCYLGGLFALGASSLRSALPKLAGRADSGARRKALNEVKMHWQLAENLTETCRFSCFSRTGLPPNYLFVNNPEEIQAPYFNEYHLSPELAETYLTLWRLTKNPRYREYAWTLVNAIAAHCQTPTGGYSNIGNVEEIPTHKVNYQPPHFLGATLKYLYLIFTDDEETILPLDRWVFNRAGQPLPVCGKTCY